MDALDKNSRYLLIPVEAYKFKLERMPYHYAAKCPKEK
jgi:hypothetical protein